MKKFIIAWGVLVFITIGGSLVLMKHNHIGFADSTGKAMVVDMGLDRLDKMDCNTLSEKECFGIRSMLTKTYTSSYAEVYRTLIAVNPDPLLWDKKTAIAIQDSYQEAIKAGAGTSPTLRMDAVKSHYKRQQHILSATVVLVLFMTLVFGKLALRERD
jgi:hypothetical protein